MTKNDQNTQKAKALNFLRDVLDNENNLNLGEVHIVSTGDGRLFLLSLDDTGEYMANEIMCGRPSYMGQEEIQKHILDTWK